MENIDLYDLLLTKQANKVKDSARVVDQLRRGGLNAINPFAQSSRSSRSSRSSKKKVGRKGSSKQPQSGGGNGILSEHTRISHGGKVTPVSTGPKPPVSDVEQQLQKYIPMHGTESDYITRKLVAQIRQQHYADDVAKGTLGTSKVQSPVNQKAQGTSKKQDTEVPKKDEIVPNARNPFSTYTMTPTDHGAQSIYITSGNDILGKKLPGINTASGNYTMAKALQKSDGTPPVNPVSNSKGESIDWSKEGDREFWTKYYGLQNTPTIGNAAKAKFKVNNNKVADDAASSSGKQVVKDTNKQLSEAANQAEKGKANLWELGTGTIIGGGGGWWLTSRGNKNQESQGQADENTTLQGQVQSNKTVGDKVIEIMHNTMNPSSQSSTKAQDQSAEGTAQQQQQANKQDGGQASKQQESAQQVEQKDVKQDGVKQDGKQPATTPTQAEAEKSVWDKIVAFVNEHPFLSSAGALGALAGGYYLLNDDDEEEEEDEYYR